MKQNRSHTYFLRGLLSALLTLMSPILLAESKPNVLTTTNIVNDLVVQIGGDKIQVESLMGPGIDPHYYKATFSDMRKLAHADMVFYSGLNLEGRMETVLENLSAMKPVIALSDSVDPDALISENGIIDPHFWFSAKLWIQAAYGVNHHLAQKVPEHRDYFNQRTEDYVKQLEELDQWIAQQIETIPQSQRILISAHNAFGYYGMAYNIEVMGLQGINTTSEFGLADLKILKDLIKQRNIKAVFVESTVSDRSIQSLISGLRAEGHALKLGGELLSDALGTKKSKTDTYLSMMRHNTKTILRALK